MSYNLMCGWEILRQKCNEPVLSWQMNLLACVFLHPSATKLLSYSPSLQNKKDRSWICTERSSSEWRRRNGTSSSQESSNCAISCGSSSVWCSCRVSTLSGWLPSALPLCHSPHAPALRMYSCFPFSESFSFLGWEMWMWKRGPGPRTAELEP